MPRLLHHISVRYRSGLKFISRGLHWLRQKCLKVPVQKKRP